MEPRTTANNNKRKRTKFIRTIIVHAVRSILQNRIDRARAHTFQHTFHQTNRIRFHPSKRRACVAIFRRYRHSRPGVTGRREVSKKKTVATPHADGESKADTRRDSICKQKRAVYRTAWLPPAVRVFGTTGAHATSGETSGGKSRYLRKS